MLWHGTHSIRRSNICVVSSQQPHVLVMLTMRYEQVLTLRSEAESLWKKSRKQKAAPRKTPATHHRKSAIAFATQNLQEEDTAHASAPPGSAASRRATPGSTVCPPGLEPLHALWEQHARQVLAKDPGGVRAGRGGAAGMHLVGALALVASSPKPSNVGLQVCMRGGRVLVVLSSLLP